MFHFILPLKNTHLHGRGECSIIILNPMGPIGFLSTTSMVYSLPKNNKTIQVSSKDAH